MSVLGLVRRGLLTLALLTLLGAAAALLLAPELLAPAEDALTPIYDLIGEYDTDQLLNTAVGVIAVMALVVVAIRKLSGASGEAVPVLVDDDERLPESVSVDPATVTGYAADEALDGVESLDDAREYRNDLRETAVAALQTAGESPEAAHRRIEQGAWTDDDLAAGFLGDAVPVPLLARLRGWLDEGTEGRRRLVRSIDAVATLATAPDAATRTPIEEEIDE
ncbi:MULTISPECIES: DUF7269 family protein [Halolamina]|uniref:Uncharacterized protein n=1 Tax=Halolamina pelagica TaxID=699431 RepID=A0A1I5VT86_9EURY|nr:MULTISPECIES: hypothetical protein [Halolamina]NHX37851.1 hypothetical protein [Halolamina sp. R1-12]SFQ10603.1 hypothetical protein SAMN05216277_1202 [Halolamina pelagica]